MFSQFWEKGGLYRGEICITQGAFLAQLILPQNHVLVKKKIPS
jgi:hypothetical protein